MLTCELHVAASSSFFEVLHFYKTSLLCEVMHSTFADMKHLRSVRTRFPGLCDFIQDPGHHQQPCVYIRLSPWHSPYYIGATEQDVLRREHSRSRKYPQLLRGQHAFFEPALHYWKRSNNYWLYCAIPVEIKLPLSSVWVQESKWQYLLRPPLNAPGCTDFFRKLVSVNIWLTFVVIFCPHLRHYLSISDFGAHFIPIFIDSYDRRCWMTFKHIILLFISWDPTREHRFKLCAICYRRLSRLPRFTTSCGCAPSSTSLFAQRRRSSSPKSCANANYRYPLP